MDRGRGVNAGEQRTIKISRNVWPERGYVAAQIGNGLDTQAEKLAVLIKRELSGSGQPPPKSADDVCDDKYRPDLPGATIIPRGRAGTPERQSHQRDDGFGLRLGRSS